MTRSLFHIAAADEWQAAEQSGSYERSTRGRSLADVGFVHCCFDDQVDAVAAALYAEHDGRLVLLEIDAAAVRARVHVEDLDGSGTAYPHVYGPIPVTAVRHVTPFEVPTSPAM